MTTGRYGNPNIAASGLVPIGITRFPPRFKLGYELRATLYDLAPTPEMLQLARQPDGRDRFREAYLDRLKTVGSASILTQLEAMQGDASGVVLLCYEDVTDGETWCHRLLLGEWLGQHAGLSVQAWLTFVAGLLVQAARRDATAAAQHATRASSKPRATTEAWRSA